MPNKKSKAKSTQQNPVSCLSLQHPNLNLLIDVLTSSRRAICRSHSWAYIRLPLHVLCSVVTICSLRSSLSTTSNSNIAQSTCQVNKIRNHKTVLTYSGVTFLCLSNSQSTVTKYDFRKFYNRPPRSFFTSLLKLSYNKFSIKLDRPPWLPHFPLMPVTSLDQSSCSTLSETSSSCSNIWSDFSTKNIKILRLKKNPYTIHYSPVI